MGKARDTIFGIYAHFMKKRGFSNKILSYEVLSNQGIQWRSISVLFANSSDLLFKDNILDFATLTAPRLSIFGMYTQMSVRKYIKYLHLNSMVIGGH